MVTITEEPEEKRPQKIPPNPIQKPSSDSTSESSFSNPFVFWCYLTLSVSLITFFLVSFSSFSSQDPKSWFLSLPSTLRHHYSNGRTIKVQLIPNSAPVEVFASESGPIAAEHVLLVHGIGSSSYAFKGIIDSLGSKGVRVIAIDLPGHGFSDRTIEVEEDVEIGALGRFRNVYSEIKEKGIFSAFDQLVETGQMPYQELQNPIFSRRKISKVVEIGSEEMGRVLTQVIESMGLTHLHLVLQDSAFVSSAYWILNNVASLRSVTLLDASTRPALPLWVLQVPVLREGVLGISQLYEKLIGGGEAHRVLLKGRDGGRAVLGMGRMLNYSFCIEEWGGSGELSGLPMQVLWSSECSVEYSKEGQRIATAIPQAKSVAHSGGQWPQVGSANEVAETIFELVSSLTTESTKHTKEEDSSPKHVQKILDEATGDDHDHRGHGHPRMDGYVDAYGLGH